MRLAGLIFFTLGLSLSLSAAGTTTELLSKIPLRFEPNRGQVHASEPVAWTARGPEAAYAFTADGALIRAQHQIVRLRMQGADPKAAYQPLDALAAPTSYFTAAYRGSIPGYQRLRRAAIYPGIDLVYYGSGTRLEYDFQVAPGADPGRIRLQFEGSAEASKAQLNDAGDLLIGAGDDHQAAIVQRAPVIYQTAADGTRLPVQGGYRVASDGTVSLALGKYDRSAPLIVDPVIVYAQYFFGTSADTAVAVTHDSQGFVYVAGNTQSTDFFVQGNFAILGNDGQQDAWVMKINPTAPDGNFVPFTTLYGGELNEIVKGLAVGSNGMVYITGTTTSTKLPTTTGAYATTLVGQTEVFIAAFDTNQATLTYSTYLGGTLVDDARAIAVFNGHIYVTGTTTSPTFPTTSAAIEKTPIGGTEVFITEIDPSKSGASALVASTYLPGSGDDAARAIAVDSAGLVYVAGETGSADFLVTANAAQGGYTQDGDGFLIKLNLEAGQVLYGTFFGGSGYDEIRSIIVEPTGRIGVAGYTLSTDLPVTQNAFQTSLNGYAAAFLAIIDPAAKAGAGLTYSTYFGGSFAEVTYGAARDKNGLYYLAGYTLSVDLPVTTTALSPASAGGGIDGFVAVIDPTKGLNGLIYSSYVTGAGSQLASGIDVDANGVVYAIGWATADVFPAGQTFKQTNPGDLDGFLLAFHL